MGDSAGRGRKVFFLNPRGARFDQAIHAMVVCEFEVYRLDASEPAVRIFKELGEAVLIINVDVPPGLEKWRQYCQALLKDEDTARMLIGFVSAGEAPDGVLARVRDGSGICGSFGLADGHASRRMMEVLTANGTRGQRQYIRFGGPGVSVARFGFRAGVRRRKRPSPIPGVERSLISVRHCYAER